MKRIFYFFILSHFFRKVLSLIGYSNSRINNHFLASKRYWQIQFISKLNLPFKLSSVPFEGLIYNDFISHGSSLIPKLVGTYESELNPILKEISSNPYKYIFNVGCGEGYFSCGFAILMQKSHVFSIDCNAQAITACRRLSRFNKLENRMTFLLDCRLDFSKYQKELNYKSLIFCDVEGFEKDLFLNSNISLFEKCDFIIELHDFVDSSISDAMMNYFKNTHDLELIASVSSKSKLIEIPQKYKVLFSDFLWTNLIDEDRPCEMQWLIGKSKICYDS